MAVSPLDGWMLLHVATAVDDPAALLDRFGLAPDGNRLTIGGTSIEWADGARAIAVAGPLASDDVRLLGIASAPDLSAGHVLAVRLADDDGVTAKSILRLCTAVGLVSSALDADTIMSSGSREAAPKARVLRASGWRSKAEPPCWPEEASRSANESVLRPATMM